MTAQILAALSDVQSDVLAVSEKIDAITALVEALEQPTPPPPTGAIPIMREYGGTLSNAGGKILNVSALRWLSDDVDPVVIEVPASTIDLATNGLGGLDTGAPAASSTYHMFCVLNPTTGETGVIASLSPSLAAPPAGFTVKAYMWPMLTDAAGDWIKFSQMGNEFLRDEPFPFPSIGNPGNMGNLRPAGVPTGVKLHAKLMVAMYNVSATVRSLLVSSPDQADVPATGTRFSLRSSGSSAADRQSSEFLVRTDTAGNFRTRMESSDGNTGIFYTNFGWYVNQRRCL